MKVSKYNYLAALLFVLFVSVASAQTVPSGAGRVLYPKDIQTGAQKMNDYLPLISGEKVAVVANQSSLVGASHLVDTLLARGVRVVRVFSPEHGFRGDKDAGATVKNQTDKKTGIPIISLYGQNKKPRPEQLKGIDVVLFDLQDVGARFYTYISTMTYVMEACAENKKKFIVLDRPNPNGFYVDGPVLDLELKSFVGMHPVPVVHGLTVAEYATMVNEEKWLNKGIKADLTVIKVEGYRHSDFYQLPVKPSPNLPNMRAIYLYPSLCLFEGTVVSVGRGTEKPFQIFGHPSFKNAPYQFTPEPRPGASMDPPYKGRTCSGHDVSAYADSIMSSPRLYLSWLKEAHANVSDTAAFFNNYFKSLAGNRLLQAQIEQNVSEQEIRESWNEGIKKYMGIRKKYLLYEDF